MIKFSKWKRSLETSDDWQTLKMCEQQENNLLMLLRNLLRLESKHALSSARWWLISYYVSHWISSRNSSVIWCFAHSNSSCMVIKDLKHFWSVLINYRVMTQIVSFPVLGEYAKSGLAYLPRTLSLLPHNHRLGLVSLRVHSKDLDEDGKIEPSTKRLNSIKY